MVDDRRALLDRLYELLAELARQRGGARKLGTSTGRDEWPSQGVYFLFEDGEFREDGRTKRVVRVGSHALTATSRTTLWNRLHKHRGMLRGRYPGSGVHRTSILRGHVGWALIEGGGFDEAAATWRDKSDTSRRVLDRELALERAVSQFVGAMDVLALPVPAREDRSAIESGCIALLSNHSRAPIDPPSAGWLGHRSKDPDVRLSGLWNVRDVRRPVEPGVLDLFAKQLRVRL